MRRLRKLKGLKMLFLSLHSTSCFFNAARYVWNLCQNRFTVFLYSSSPNIFQFGFFFCFFCSLFFDFESMSEFVGGSEQRKISVRTRRVQKIKLYACLIRTRTVFFGSWQQKKRMNLSSQIIAPDQRLTTTADRRTETCLKWQMYSEWVCANRI